MRYRTKLLILFLLSGVLSTSLTVGIMLKQRWQLLFEQRQSKLKTLVATGAVLIPGEALTRIHDQSDETTPSYLQLQKLLQDIWQANRRGKRNFQIDHVYALRMSPTLPGKVAYVADAGEGRAARIPVGAVYPVQASQQIKRTLETGQILADADFHRDAWGQWLSAYAPLRDKTGKVVGAVGADLAAQTVEENLTSGLTSGLMGMGIAFPLLVGCALLLSAWVTRPLQAVKSAANAIGKGNLAARVSYTARDEFGEVAQAINCMAEGLEERERVKSASARYVSQSVLERVLQTGNLSILKGDRRRITVLFSDIRDFTTLAETRHPEEIVSLLNVYFELMIEIVFRNHGCVDKFIGDGLMVTFGAFEDTSQHERHAVKAALEMHEALQELCTQWKQEGKPMLRIGIGIHTGDAIVGEIGSSQRVEFTALGDTVNLASRLESACKELKARIVISEATYAAVSDLLQCTDQGHIQVKGRLAQVHVYSVEGLYSIRKAA